MDPMFTTQKLQTEKFCWKSFPVFGVKTIEWIKICQIELNFSRKFCNLLEFLVVKQNYKRERNVFYVYYKNAMCVCVYI